MALNLLPPHMFVGPRLPCYYQMYSIGICQIGVASNST
jgi:hypothetical protein